MIYFAQRFTALVLIFCPLAPPGFGLTGTPAREILPLSPFFAAQALANPSLTSISSPAKRKKADLFTLLSVDDFHKEIQELAPFDISKAELLEILRHQRTVFKKKYERKTGTRVFLLADHAAALKEELNEEFLRFKDFADENELTVRTIERFRTLFDLFNREVAKALHSPSESTWQKWIEDKEIVPQKFPILGLRDDFELFSLVCVDRLYRSMHPGKPPPAAATSEQTVLNVLNGDPVDWADANIDKYAPSLRDHLLKKNKTLKDRADFANFGEFISWSMRNSRGSQSSAGSAAESVIIKLTKAPITLRSSEMRAFEIKRLNDLRGLYKKYKKRKSSLRPLVHVLTHLNIRLGQERIELARAIFEAMPNVQRLRDLYELVDISADELIALARFFDNEFTAGHLTDVSGSPAGQLPQPGMGGKKADNTDFIPQKRMRGPAPQIKPAVTPGAKLSVQPKVPKNAARNKFRDAMDALLTENKIEHNFTDKPSFWAAFERALDNYGSAEEAKPWIQQMFTYLKSHRVADLQAYLDGLFRDPVTSRSGQRIKTSS